MDLFTASRDAIANGTPIAFVLAILFGIASSFGPCMASRLIVVSSIAQKSRRSPAMIVAAFMAGLLAVYIAFALAAHVVALAQILQGQLALFAAAIFLIGGVFVFVQAYIVEKHHEHEHSKSSPHSLMGAAGLGALAALNLNPCCAPWLLMALTYTGLQHNVLFGCALMVAFAIGHALPMFIYGQIAARVSALLSSAVAQRAVPLASCSLMLFLAVYYVVQA